MVKLLMKEEVRKFFKYLQNFFKAFTTHASYMPLEIEIDFFLNIKFLNIFLRTSLKTNN